MKQILSKRNRTLLAEMIRTDFKLRYQGSVLGYLWSLLKPLMLFGILYTVFTKILKIGVGVPNWPISLLLGIVLWNFFAESTSTALKSVVGKGNLIRKINIPRYLIPIAAISSAFINTLLNMIVVFIFVAFATATPISWISVVVFPLLLFELAIVSVATGFFLAAFYVRFRDIEHIWDIIRQALFYAIPIIYPLSIVANPDIQKIILLNPLAQIIQDARSVITSSETEQIAEIFGSYVYYAIPLSLILVALLVSSQYFRNHSKNFAEEI